VTRVGAEEAASDEGGGALGVGADEADVVLLLEEQLQRPRRYPSTWASKAKMRRMTCCCRPYALAWAPAQVHGQAGAGRRCVFT
jgi:hypothetical protein